MDNSLLEYALVMAHRHVMPQLLRRAVAHANPVPAKVAVRQTITEGFIFIASRQPWEQRYDQLLLAMPKCCEGRVVTVIDATNKVIGCEPREQIGRNICEGIIAASQCALTWKRPTSGYCCLAWEDILYLHCCHGCFSQNHHDYRFCQCSS